MIHLRWHKRHKDGARLVRRLFSTDAFTRQLIKELSMLDTASLCDADKNLYSIDESYRGIKLVQGLKPRNCQRNAGATMVGTARTVQTERNDFLAVLQVLNEAESGDVLVINTLNSSRAVAGELFTAEAERRGVHGILVDGPMRDTAYLEEFPSVQCYSTSVTPYSGTIQAVGKTQVEIECGGAKVSPGDIVVADNDGIIVGSAVSFNRLLESASVIQKTEEAIKIGISQGVSLHSMTNYEEHLKAREAGNESSLSFRLP